VDIDCVGHDSEAVFIDLSLRNADIETSCISCLRGAELLQHQFYLGNGYPYYSALRIASTTVFNKAIASNTTIFWNNDDIHVSPTKDAILFLIFMCDICALSGIGSYWKEGQ
jgi:hypothetical protein